MPESTARRICLTALALALATLALWVAPVAAEDPASHTVACAPTLMPLMERVVQSLAERYPSLELSLRETDSALAAQSLLAGEVAMAGLTRQITPLEEAQARGKNLRLTGQRVGTDCLLAVVHPSNPVFDLTTDELAGIFSGRIRNWGRVGGKDKPVMVVVRPPASGAAQLWQTKVMDRVPPREDASVQESHEDVLQTVAANKLGIGYISVGFLDPSVKALSLGGVNPGTSNVKTGRYPVCRPLMLVTTGQPGGAAKAALDFLVGPQGQALVRELGFLPLK